MNITKSPMTTELGRMLLLEQLRRGLNGQELAYELGITRQTLSKIENGGMAKTSAKVIAAYYGMKTEKVLAMMSSPAPAPQMRVIHSRAKDEPEADFAEAPNALAAYLKRWRAENGLTQEQAAERADMDCRIWQDAEYGTRCRSATLRKIAGAVGLTLPQAVSMLVGEEVLDR